MRRVLFLLIVLFSLFSFINAKDQPVAIKYDEFETASQEYFKWKMLGYFNKLKDTPYAFGQIIIYGTRKESLIRERQIEKAISFERIERFRIFIIKGGFCKVINTELWIVPRGAIFPRPDTKTIKIDEFGVITQPKMMARFKIFLNEIFGQNNQKGYILSRGSPRAISVREKFFKNYLSTHRFDLSKVKFLRDETEKNFKTEFWIDLAKIPKLDTSK